MSPSPSTSAGMIAAGGPGSSSVTRRTGMGVVPAIAMEGSAAPKSRPIQTNGRGHTGPRPDMRDMDALTSGAKRRLPLAQSAPDRLEDGVGARQPQPAPDHGPSIHHHGELPEMAGHQLGPLPHLLLDLRRHTGGAGAVPS